MGDDFWLVISDTKKTGCAVGNKHSVYYIEGKITKSFDEIQQAVNERKMIEVVSRKNGQRRYLDYEKGGWYLTSGFTK